MKMTRKLLSGMLAVAMLISMLPMSISAEGAITCTHHKEHNEACGYEAEYPCNHKHSAECQYVEAHDCEHQHNALCGTDGATCSHKTHNADCKYAEYVPCNHVHSADVCTYAAEKPCNYDYANCPECKLDAAKAAYPNSPVYIIKSGEGSFILNKYEGGVMNQIETKNSNGLYTPMKFVDGANYAPFRYLFEEFGLQEVASDLCTATNPADLKNFDMSAVEIPEGKLGVYIALYGEKAIDVDGSKKVVLLVKLATNPNEKIILIQDEELTDSQGRPIYDENGNKVQGKVKILENSTYIPLRALQLCGMHVRYDANAKAAYILPKSVEYTLKETEALKTVSSAEKINPIALESADKALLDNATNAYNDMISNSYVNYAKVYTKKDGTVSVIEGAYCVNQVGDYLVYVDESLKIRVGKFNSAGAMETFAVSSDTIFLCDTVIFDGYNVYGIKVKSADTVAGSVFVAKLTRTNDGYKLIEYKEVPGIASAHALRFNDNKLYFIDDDDNCKIKTVSTSGNKDTIAVAAEDAGKEIFAFDVCGENIFYDNNNDKAYLNGVEFPNADGMYVREVVANQNYTDGEGVLFYYTLENGDANYLYAIRKGSDGSVASVLEDSQWNGHKIRNLTMIGEKVYASVNGNLTVLK